jgi:hypothetical protein
MKPGMVEDLFFDLVEVEFDLGNEFVELVAMAGFSMVALVPRSVSSSRVDALLIRLKRTSESIAEAADTFSLEAFTAALKFAEESCSFFILGSLVET